MLQPCRFYSYHISSLSMILISENMQVWPGQLHFVDYWHPMAEKYWTEQLSQFYHTLARFDGIWIDMNEPSNFCGAPG